MHIFIHFNHWYPGWASGANGLNENVQGYSEIHKISIFVYLWIALNTSFNTSLHLQFFLPFFIYFFSLSWLLTIFFTLHVCWIFWGIFLNFSNSFCVNKSLNKLEKSRQKHGEKCTANSLNKTLSHANFQKDVAFTMF